MTPDYLSPADVKRDYGIGRSQLNQLRKAGRITAIEGPGGPGQAYYYTAESIEEYLMSRDNRGKRHPDPKGGE